MKPKTISAILRIGSPIITTLLSFAVSPPAIKSPESSINWTKFAVLFAGALSIFAYDFLKKKAKGNILGIILLIFQLLAIAGYEFLAYKYTVSGFNSQRVVISHEPVKDTVKANLEYWTQHGQNPIVSLVKAFRGDSSAIWELPQLNAQYYSLLLVYFLNVGLLTSLLIFLGEKSTKPR